jgi:oligoendopeptidase F
MKNLPNWDLTDFYSSISDKKIKKDLQNAKNEAANFSKNNLKKVKNLSGIELFNSIKLYEEISEKSAKVASYAYLIYASDLSNQEFVAFYQDVCEEIAEIEKELVFFALEINEIDEKLMQKLLKSSKELQYYQPFLRDVSVFKKYQLSSELEKFSLEKNITARDAWVRLFDETVNNLEFDFNGKKLSNQEIFDILSDKDRQKRKKAAKAIGETFKKNIKIFAFITNILAKNKAVEDSWRGFEKPIQSRNLSNFVEDKIVDTLVKSVKKNYQEISHKYYAKKAKMLGLKKMKHYDRNAPLGDVDKKIPWEKAKSLVLEAYGEFDPKIAEIAKMFFDKNWIDAGVKKGKDSGAFSHPCVPSVHPYILMNYQGKVRDVMTLAHELGHGVHQFLAAKQGFFQSSTPLTLAETASVFGEQLTFQKILADEKNEERKKLIIAGKVEDMINTAIRQIAFLEFERKIHDERKNGEIPLEKICEFWMGVQKESLGEIFDFDEEYKYFWCYIPHFIHSPFYVYSYAFGDCLVNSLYGVYQQGKVKNFEEKYIKMLESGGVKHHKEMLEPFGLDASKSEFWQNGLDVIKKYVEMI